MPKGGKGRSMGKPAGRLREALLLLLLPGPAAGPVPGPALPAARVCKGCLLRAGSAPACFPTGYIRCHGTEPGGKRGFGYPYDGLRPNRAETQLG